MSLDVFLRRLPTFPPVLQGPTLNAVKYQVCRLMRMLVELTNTLEQVGRRACAVGSACSWWD